MQRATRAMVSFLGVSIFARAQKSTGLELYKKSLQSVYKKTQKHNVSITRRIKKSLIADVVLTSTVQHYVTFLKISPYLK